MKYTGKKPSGRDKGIDVFEFSLGKDELEILAKLVQQAYDATPKVFEIMPYRGRLRNMSLVLAKVWIEVVKGNLLPTKRTSATHRRITKHLTS